MADTFSLATPEINLEYKRGDSRAIVFILKNASTKLPIDVTSYTLPVLAVNSEAAPTDTSNEQFTVDGTVGSTDGKISFEPNTTDTDLVPATYFFDAQVLDDSANKLTFVKGKFKIVQDIAKD